MSETVDRSLEPSGWQTSCLAVGYYSHLFASQTRSFTVERYKEGVERDELRRRIKSGPGSKNHAESNVAWKDKKLKKKYTWSSSVAARRSARDKRLNSGRSVVVVCVEMKHVSQVTRIAANWL